MFVIVLVCDTAHCQFHCPMCSFLLCVLKLATLLSAVQSEEQVAGETMISDILNSTAIPI